MVNNNVRRITLLKSIKNLMKSFYCETFHLWPEYHSEIQRILQMSSVCKPTEAKHIHVASWLDDKLIKVEIWDNLISSFEEFSKVYKKDTGWEVPFSHDDVVSLTEYGLKVKMDRLHRDYKSMKVNRLNDIKFFRMLADNSTKGLSTLYTIVDMNEYRFKHDQFKSRTQGFYKYSLILDASPHTFDNIEDMLIQNVFEFDYTQRLKRTQQDIVEFLIEETLCVKKESVDLTEPIKLNLKLTPSPKLSYLLAMIYDWYDKAQEESKEEKSVKSQSEAERSLKSGSQEVAKRISKTEHLDDQFLGCFVNEEKKSLAGSEKEELEIKQLDILAEKLVQEQKNESLLLDLQEEKKTLEVRKDSFDEAPSDEEPTDLNPKKQESVSPEPTEKVPE